MTPESTRREGIRSKSIVLSDGREWGFSLPSRLIRPRISDSFDAFGRRLDRVTVEVVFGFPLFIRRLIDRLRSTLETDSIADQYEAFMSLARARLLRAHDIDSSTACQLLNVSEENFPALAHHVLRIVEFDLADYVEEME